MNNQVKFLLGDDHVERLDPRVANGEFSLDGVMKTDDLIAKAAHHSKIFMPRFKERFSDHFAPEFTPLHR